MFLSGRGCEVWRLGTPGTDPVGFAPRPLAPTGPNQCWAYDFVFDACANGQKLKCLTIVDEWTREALAIDVAGAIRSSRVIEVPARLISIHGAPRYVPSDNGSKFLSTAVLKWPVAAGIDAALSDPGKPWQNGTDETWSGKFRDECQNVEWFRARVEVVAVIESWRQHYNEVRPHSSLNCLTPNQFRNGSLSPSTHFEGAESK